MATCAQVMARTLRELGIERMFGLPGGEILAFIDAAREEGIEFLLTRHEATASFMADVTGQIERRPGVCVSTLGPGAMNMVLGVANAWLDRSPMLAVTASTAEAAAPYATHQNLDLAGLYGRFTKASIKLDGRDTEAKVRRAFELSVQPRMGPVHLALPSDVANAEDRAGTDTKSSAVDSVVDASSSRPEPAPGPPGERQMSAVAAAIAAAERPAVIVGLDLDPLATTEAVRRFVDVLGAPVFATPKAKGIVPEDHPLFCGVCAGVAGDDVVVDFFEQSDLLVGLGFEPVESDKLWHQTMKLVSIGPVSIASGAFAPHLECVGEINEILRGLEDQVAGSSRGDDESGPDHARGRIDRFRERLRRRLSPETPPDAGLSPFELTLRLRELLPRETIHVTDVGSIKFITTQAWKAYEPLTFFESNGLSSMSYGFPGAMAATLCFPDRPVLCTIGDGGFSMTVAELETCIRYGINFVTVVYNDDALSLIRVAQQSKGLVRYGVDYGAVDFAAVAAAFGAWSRRVESLEKLDAAVEEALGADRPAVIDVVVDPTEYAAHAAS